MKIEKVNAVVRFSLDTGHGWKSLELGCEASVDERENWQTAQATLYGQLAQQFKALWAANGATPQVKEGHEMNAQPSQEPTPPPAPPKEHWCSQHGVAFVGRKGKNGATFYSHRQEDGWHNEK